MGLLMAPEEPVRTLEAKAHTDVPCVEILDISLA